MKRINLIIFFIFLSGFFQLILVYRNFRLMNEIANLEEKKKLLIIRIKKENVYLDSLSIFSSFLQEKSLEMKFAELFRKDSNFPDIIEITEIAKKENGEE